MKTDDQGNVRGRSDRELKLKAQQEVNEIVTMMLRKGYKVEAIDKKDYSPDEISVDGFGGWTTHYHENIARILVGGWFNKSALISLTQILLERGQKNA